MNRNNLKNKRIHSEKCYIMGKNCVEEVIKASPQRLKKVFMANSDVEMRKKLDYLGIPYQIVNKSELFNLVHSESHQSIVALVSERNFPHLDEYLENTFEKDKDLILVLDSIGDPQNLGTLLRCAECFDVGAVMWSKNRGVDLTAVARKTSVGGSELVTIIKVSNLVESVKKAQKEGYEVVTAEIGEGTKSLPTFQFPKKTLLIMGSEGVGVRQLLSKQADHRIYIPMLGLIDSLNVSQATSIILYQWQNFST